MGVEIPAANSQELPKSLQLLQENFPDDVREAVVANGDAVARVAAGAVRRILEFLKSDARLLFSVLVDITAVDYLGREPRFEVVYNLVSMAHRQRVRLRVEVGGDHPEVDSVAELWGCANWLEREVWDMYGIGFRGHPDLKRILLYPEFQGHPLRKDYPIQRRQPLIGPKN